MPGITLVAGKDVRSERVIASVKSIAREIETVELLFEHAGIAIVWNAHESYPKREVRTALGYALLEGTVLGNDPDRIGEELRRLIAAVHEDPLQGRNAAEAWASNAEGDFVLVLVAYRHQCVLITNDALGRLPLFIRTASDATVISREIKCCVAISGPGIVDRGTIAQILLFGFPLGPRTLINEIRRLGPCSSITVEIVPPSHRIHPYRTWNFEEMIERGRSPVVSDLVDVFQATCAAQASLPGFSKAVLSLSGGLDSRAVAGGLSRAQKAFQAVTFHTATGEYAADAVLAEPVARMVGAPWRLYTLDDATWEATVQTVLLRDGLNFAGMARALQYFALLRRDWGTQAMCFTGNGGDKVFPDLRAPWWVTTLDRFVRYRLERLIWPVAAVSSLLGLREGTIIDEIREYFSQYPERGIRQREVRFLMMERGWGWLLEGDERDRSFLWTQTPFYGRRFFELAMSVDPRRKRHYALFAAFLRALDPRLAALPTAKWNAPIGSRKALLADFITELPAQIPSSLRASLRDAYRRVAVPSQEAKPRLTPIVERASYLLESDPVREVFPGLTLRKLQTCSDAQFGYLLTQLLYLDHTWGREKSR